MRLHPCTHMRTHTRMCTQNVRTQNIQNCPLAGNSGLATSMQEDGVLHETVQLHIPHYLLPQIPASMRRILISPRSESCREEVPRDLQRSFSAQDTTAGCREVTKSGTQVVKWSSGQVVKSGTQVVKSGTQVVKWSSGQVVKWSSQVHRWSSQVHRWSSGQVVKSGTQVVRYTGVQGTHRWSGTQVYRAHTGGQVHRWSSGMPRPSLPTKVNSLSLNG